VNAEISATLGTAIATLVLLVLPTVAYAYYVLEHWIDDRDSYQRVIAAVERTRQQAGRHQRPA
jgi:hypothetical protein